MRTKSKAEINKEIKALLYNVLGDLDPTFKQAQYSKKTKGDLERVIYHLKTKLDEVELKLGLVYDERVTMDTDLVKSKLMFKRKSGNRATEENLVEPFAELSSSHRVMREHVKEISASGGSPKEIIDKLVDASDTLDPISFHMAVMNGHDPRITSIIYKLMEIIRFDMKKDNRVLPNIDEWVQVVGCVYDYYVNETVSMSTSIKASTELLSVTVPKLKQIEQTTKTVVSRLDKIGIDPEAMKILSKDETKEFIRLIKKIKNASNHEQPIK